MLRLQELIREENSKNTKKQDQQPERISVLPAKLFIHFRFLLLTYKECIGEGDNEQNCERYVEDWVEHGA